MNTPMDLQRCEMSRGKKEFRRRRKGRGRKG
jgi:hypothetical protein